MKILLVAAGIQDQVWLVRRLSNLGQELLLHLVVIAGVTTANVGISAKLSIFNTVHG